MKVIYFLIFAFVVVNSQEQLQTGSECTDVLPDDAPFPCENYNQMDLCDIISEEFCQLSCGRCPGSLVSVTPPQQLVNLSPETETEQEDEEEYDDSAEDVIDDIVGPQSILASPTPQQEPLQEPTETELTVSTAPTPEVEALPSNIQIPRQIVASVAPTQEISQAIELQQEEVPIAEILSVAVPIPIPAVEQAVAPIVEIERPTRQITVGGEIVESSPPSMEIPSELVMQLLEPVIEESPPPTLPPPIPPSIPPPPPPSPTVQQLPSDTTVAVPTPTPVTTPSVSPVQSPPVQDFPIPWGNQAAQTGYINPIVSVNKEWVPQQSPTGQNVVPSSPETGIGQIAPQTPVDDSECVDQLPEDAPFDCQTYDQMGLCSSISEDFCQRSCGRCPPTTQQTGCEDIEPPNASFSCSEYTTMGLCSSLPQDFCQVSCETCAQPQVSAPSIPTPLPAPEPETCPTLNGCQCKQTWQFMNTTYSGCPEQQSFCEVDASTCPDALESLVPLRRDQEIYGYADTCNSTCEEPTPPISAIPPTPTPTPTAPPTPTPTIPPTPSTPPTPPTPPTPRNGTNNTRGGVSFALPPPAPFDYYGFGVGNLFSPPTPSTFTPTPSGGGYTGGAFNALLAGLLAPYYGPQGPPVGNLFAPAPQTPFNYFAPGTGNLFGYGYP